MAINRAVAMATRVAGKDEGNGKSGKSNGDGNKEGKCKEEGNGEQRRQQDYGNRDNNDAANTMTTMTTRTTVLTIMMKTMTKTDKTMVRQRWGLLVAGGGGEGNKRGSGGGVECSYFLSKLDSGCCWLLVRGRGGRREAMVPSWTAGYLFNCPATPVPSTLLRALRNLMCRVVDLPVPGLRATPHSGNDSTATWMCHVLGPHTSGDHAIAHTEL
jgi:hypothetical protein